jgi:large subunit ribosomal protein L9
MKVILLKEVESLGKYGDVVEVKRGYARNKLIPGKLAMEHTEASIKVVKELEKRQSMKARKQKDESLVLKEQLEKISLTCPIYAGADVKVFGAVTNIDIEKLLKKEGFKIDKKDILLAEPIKELGVYPVQVHLHPEVNAEIKLWVVSEEIK